MYFILCTSIVRVDRYRTRSDGDGMLSSVFDPVATAPGSVTASTSKSNGERPDRQRGLKFLSSNVLSNPNAAVDSVYQYDWGRIVATLIRNFGDFDIAEEAAQEAFTAAVDQWRATGVPEFPAAWIIQT